MASASPPSTTRVYRRTTGPYPLTLTSTTTRLPALGPHDVLLRIRAVALNFRDVAMLHEGRYPVRVAAGGIPGSDCAGEVVRIGAGVKRFRVGDRVAPTLDLAHLTGEGKEREAGICALGGDSDSVALLQGTGGVSMFALQLCIAAGIKPIITSSSDEKLEAIKKLSPAVEGINYKKHADVAAEVLRLTEGKGVDIVVNNTGMGSFPSDFASLRKRYGTISWVGFLEGFKGDWDPSHLFALMTKSAKIQGIAVGSRKDFEDVCKFLEDKKVQLTPIIDRVFTFDEAPQAFEYLYSGKHTGKVVIKL
ncbi:putative alcohol dehydrogenase [Diplodia seriata]|uniref:Putative alcohol dehydrogenase n=1 Tax=Diplodia seriata TaxID=420778 RepID=A0A0G2HF34_9PEZI|nr:putative alcohol dehydrogenase [Diplodia seriata]